METFSKLVPLKASRFISPLKDELLASNPTIWEENLAASYILRSPGQYTANPTRASIAVTSDRLVVMATGKKKIDIPLHKSFWPKPVEIWFEKRCIAFKMGLDFNGVGESVVDLTIKVRCGDPAGVLGLIERAQLVPDPPIPGYILAQAKTEAPRIS